VALSRIARALIVGALALAAFAPPAQADLKLTVAAARERAATFAERTCRHDENCAGAGVKNCRRQSRRVVICRIFDLRKTIHQGNFICTRLVRLALQPGVGRVPVTGVGLWSC
jgi:hypothetical protein